MKRLVLFLGALGVVVLACAGGTAAPAADQDLVNRIAAQTLTALASVPAAPSPSPQPAASPTAAPVAFPTVESAPTFPTLPAMPIRVQFPPGGVSASVSGVAAFSRPVEYILYAMQGQRMTVSIQSPGNAANFSITGVLDGQPFKRLVNEDRSFEMILPLTQDYLIAVAVPAGNASFTLTVVIVWP